MATTSSNLTAGTAITGRGNNGMGKKGRAAGLVATAALGLSLLTGLVFTQAHQGGRSAIPSVAPAAQLSPAARERELNLLREQNALPELAGLTPGVERQHFLEQNLTLPSNSPATSSSTSEQRHFLEQNLWLPGAGAAAVVDPRIWTGSCRPGGSGCQPDEDYAASAPTPARPQVWAGACRAGGSDCIPDEELVAPAQVATSPRGYTRPCRAGGSDCVPDEDILAGGPAQPVVADQFTYREDHRASAPASVTGSRPSRQPSEYRV